MAFSVLFMQHFAANWASYYFPLILASLALAFILRGVTRAMLAFTLQLLLLFLLLLAGSAVSQAINAAEIARLLHGVAVLALGMLLIRQAGLAVFRLVVPRLGMRPPRILEEILILLAYVGWILLRLSVAGLDLGSLVASTAVITAVLAFAMQDTLGNILSGLALQLDHSVHIGDWVELDGVTGQVVQVQWRHTALRTLFGEMILVPNSQLMKSRVMITGGTSVPHRLRTVFFYGDEGIWPADVIAAIEQELKNAEFDAVLPDPAPVCLITDFSAGVITYAVRYWLTDPSSPGRMDSLVRQHIHAVFRRKGWRLAAPAMDMTMARRSMATSSVSSSISDIEQRVQILKAIDLFSPLTDEELHDLAGRLKHMNYVEGSLIAEQGAVGDCLYVIAAGHAAVWLEAHSGRQLLAEVGPGQILGEMSLMTGEPRRATLTARDNLSCYVLGKDDFQITLQQRPELADMFAQLLAVRSQELSRVRDHRPTTASHTEKAAILARIRNLFRL